MTRRRPGNVSCQHRTGNIAAGRVRSPGARDRLPRRGGDRRRRARVRHRRADRRDACERLPARGRRRRRRGARARATPASRSSYYGAPGTLETDLINRANPGWEKLLRPARRAVPPDRRADGRARRRGGRAAPRTIAAEAAGVAACAPALLDGPGARAREPLVSSACRAAVHLPDDGIVDPVRPSPWRSRASPPRMAPRPPFGAAVTGIEPRGRREA